ncbi:adenylyltransferase/cytidyltransferase family protein [Ruminococcaceae bacterium OttesenSCG-928-A11]|nr:adenylyltransferase/cytidyltransferase family protein [Ruminococcaceae bacterium OttesenSCG-928-A11]
MAELQWGRPFTGKALERVRRFLAENGLRYDADIACTVVLLENGEPAATGSLAGNVVKCVCVAPNRQAHLFLYTKPENAQLFSGLAFYPLARTAKALLMENRRHGVSDFVASVRHPAAAGVVGCVVANCNPFTLGHRYLIETAAARCDFLYLFLLSEDRGLFSPAQRMAMAKAGTADLSNLAVVPTGPYLVSAATFPAYFLDGADVPDREDIGGELDLAVFGRHFAGPLGITRRFVGSEPYSPTTAAYNRAMHAMLPGYGVAVTELPRRAVDGAAVSASRVRALLARGQLMETRPLVPPTTFDYLQNMEEPDGGGTKNREP